MNKKYIIYAVLGVAIVGSFLLGRGCSPKVETKYLPSEIVYELRDTCIASKTLCTITTKDSMSIYRIIREGFKTKSEKVKPQIDVVVEATPEQKQEELLQRTYTKIMNNGVTTVWDTITVLGKIVDWTRAHKQNEVVEVQEKITTTTAVIEQGTDDSHQDKLRYLPVESNPVTRFGIYGGASYTDIVRYKAGIYRQGKNNIIIQAGPIFEENKPVGGEAQIAIPLIKGKQK